MLLSLRGWDLSRLEVFLQACEVSASVVLLGRVEFTKLEVKREGGTEKKKFFFW